MPTYEYACTSCAEHIEVVQSFTDASLTECPSCSGRLRKVFSPVGVVFKGSGFYKTDSRDTKSKAAKSESKADTKSESTSGSSSESSGAASASTAAKSSDTGSASTPSSTPSTGTAAAAS